MKLFITFVIAFFAVSSLSFANTGNPSRNIRTKKLIVALKEQAALFAAPEKTARICSCQLLKVASTNEKEQLIAVFAEGTNHGDLSAAFSIGGSLLQKEKKHLENLFYTKVKLEEKITASTSCSLLYSNLKVKYDAVKMYEVLDADALNQLNNTHQ